MAGKNVPWTLVDLECNVWIFIEHMFQGFQPLLVRLVDVLGSLSIPASPIISVLDGRIYCQCNGEDVDPQPYCHGIGSLGYS